MLNEIKTLLTNRLAVLIILLTLLWSAVDSSSRLFAIKTNSAAKSKTFKVAPLIMPQPSSQLVARLSAAYKRYRRDNKDAISHQQGLSLAEQAKQRGELKKLFIGDNKLELKAVLSVALTKKTMQQTLSKKLDTQQLNALIAITNIKTGKQKIEKHSNNSLLYGYLLTIKNNTQVVLTKRVLTDNQSIKPELAQHIVLTMYKSSQ